MDTTDTIIRYCIEQIERACNEQTLSALHAWAIGAMNALEESEELSPVAAEFSRAEIGAAYRKKADQMLWVRERARERCHG
jgi:hypothetical protein